MAEYQIKKYTKENNISQKVAAYDIVFSDSDKYVLGCILSGSVPYIKSLWQDIIDFKKMSPEQRLEYLDNKYGVWDDVISSEDYGDCFLDRENTSHNLGMVGCLSYIESLCGALYRFSDSKVFIKHYLDDTIPLYEITFEEFEQVVRWWVNETEALENITII